MAVPIPHLSASAPSETLRPGSDPVAHTLALLRPWIDYVPRQQRRLGLFILLALLMHLAIFFFIRIDTTRVQIAHPVPVRVSVESQQVTSREGGPGDEFWDELTDPRLFILPRQSPAALTSAGPGLDFTAINSRIGSGELPPPVAPEDYRVAPPTIAPLAQRVELAMRPPRQPFSYDETPPAIAATTTWQWDSALDERHPQGVPALPSPISDTDLSPTELRVAVDPNGTVQHVLVEQSCGEMGASIARDLDEQAALAAQKIRFQPTDQPGLLWGRITIFWRYAAKPREEVVPTPPSAGT